LVEGRAFGSFVVIDVQTLRAVLDDQRVHDARRWAGFGGDVGICVP
jgi:hypothetical protein